MKPTPTTERVRELLRYKNGSLFWISPGPYHTRGAVGTPAGVGGRLQFEIDGRATYVHHVVWLMHRGEWPPSQVDHINGDRLDNRIENLRLLSTSENCQNRHHRGVTFEARKVERPWRARIMKDGRSVSLGYFESEEEAQEAYRSAKLQIHEPYATGVGAL